MISTFAIVPPLIAAFALLAFDHYRINPKRSVANLRYILMVGAVIAMFTDILLGNVLPWISVPLFILAWLWLATAALLVGRRLLGI